MAPKIDEPTDLVDQIADIPKVLFDLEGPVATFLSAHEEAVVSSEDLLEVLVFGSVSVLAVHAVDESLLVNYDITVSAGATALICRCWLDSGSDGVQLVDVESIAV